MICEKCLLSDAIPGVQINSKGICNCCQEKNVQIFEKKILSEQDLIVQLKSYLEKANRGKYDVLIPVSGGVDSSIALMTIVEKMGLKVLAYHNDHGYEEKIATENVKKICKGLGVDLVIVQQDLNFMKKLWKYVATSDEKISGCYVCGNILYLNSLQIAHDFNIPVLVNGYSKGQAAMTRDKGQGLANLEKILEIIGDGYDKVFQKEVLEKYSYLKYKKDYDPYGVLSYEIDKILVIPFFVFDFYHTEKEKSKKLLQQRFCWEEIPYSYPKRTTNCKMAWLNSYIDLQKMGYTMYHQEYSELIRCGEITREQAMKDLEFSPPENLIEDLAHDLDINLNLYNNVDNWFSFSV